MESKKNVKYIQQCWSSVHEDQTIALDFKLEPVDPSRDDIPALSLHNAFSRYTVTIIDNSSTERKIVSANIRASEVPFLLQEYELALHDKRAFLKKGTEESAADSTSKAYSVKIRAGIFKGQTPAEILLADPSKRDNLMNTKDWLLSNIEKYPANQEVVDAIDDADYLFSTGQLNADKAGSLPSAACTVFDERFKVVSSGAADKKVRCEITITCEFDRKNAWCVRIKNSEVPVVNGKVDNSRVLRQQAATIYLNDKEIAAFIDAIRTTKLLFENYAFASAYDFVEQNKWKPSGDTKHAPTT